AFCSVEFRTDNLWAPLWLLCMLVLLDGALTMRRALIAGFLMGLCFGVSMKTLLLLMSTVVGGSMTLIFVGRERLDIGWRQILGAGFFFTALVSFWPFLSRHDYLPLYPLAFVICTGAVLTILDGWAKNRNIPKIWRVMPVSALFGVCELLVALLVHPFWQDKAK